MARVSTEPVQEEGAEEATASRRWYADWRVWATIAFTATCFWISMRDVPLDEVMAAVERADLTLLLVVSVPSYIAAVWVRALRWRYLTEGIAPMPRGALFRAMAIGFTVNNLLPLRVGELARSWYLARETGTSATSVFASVALDRVIDVVALIMLAMLGLAFAGSGTDEAGLLAKGALLLLPIALAPLVGLIALRVKPELIFGIARFFTRPLPDRLGNGIESALHRFGDGLGALRGGSHLLWIVLHSATIWLVLSTIPMLAGMAAFGIDLGSPVETLVLSWVVLAVVGVAVAIPQAPGFFGVY